MAEAWGRWSGFSSHDPGKPCDRGLQSLRFFASLFLVCPSPLALWRIYFPWSILNVCELVKQNFKC